MKISECFAQIDLFNTFTLVFKLIVSLGAIEAEIQQFEYRPVSRNRPFLVKFTDPYLGHRLTQKSKILVLKVFHGGLSPYQISTKSVMMTSIFFLKCVDLTWNAPIPS